MKEKYFEHPVNTFSVLTRMVTLVDRELTTLLSAGIKHNRRDLNPDARI